MKLCVYCGTFNPIHNEHIEIAKFAKTELNFDKILFIPAYKPPHKNLDGKLAIHRFNMLTLALADYDNFYISDIEFKRNGYSYTIDTIEELYADIHGLDGKIKFIIGMDAFKNLNTWHNIEKLKQIVEFIVFQRDNVLTIEEVEKFKNDGFDFICAKKQFVDISSTMIREKVKNGQDIRNLVPLNVKNYIEKYGLYR
ncbi:nicotinate (nicotinamide) nucleotide adenylyltransferase [bacterium]|nr:nicotinate (nicotinamide) nucleotide adenylyltransferase [bacterium]